MKSLIVALTILSLQLMPGLQFEGVVEQAKARVDMALEQVAATSLDDSDALDIVASAIGNSFRNWHDHSELWLACAPCNAPDADASLLAAYIADQALQRAYFEIYAQPAPGEAAARLYGEVRSAIFAENVHTASSFLNRLASPEGQSPTDADWDMLSIIARHAHQHPEFMLQYLAEIAVRADRDDDRAHDLFYFMDFLAQFRMVARGQSLGAYVVCRNGTAVFEPELEDPAHTEALRARFGLTPVSAFLSERSARC